MGLILPILGIFALFKILEPIVTFLGAVVDIIEAIEVLWPFILIAVIAALVYFTKKEKRERKSD